jgi:hypothetical protein
MLLRGFFAFEGNFALEERLRSKQAPTLANRKQEPVPEEMFQTLLTSKKEGK